MVFEATCFVILSYPRERGEPQERAPSLLESVLSTNMERAVNLLGRLLLETVSVDSTWTCCFLFIVKLKILTIKIKGCLWQGGPKDDLQEMTHSPGRLHLGDGVCPLAASPTSLLSSLQSRLLAPQALDPAVPTHLFPAPGPCLGQVLGPPTLAGWAAPAAEAREWCMSRLC